MQNNFRCKRLSQFVRLTLLSHPCAGDIDDGDTTMDYMEQERNRGITIVSAAITFKWNKHIVNLIDTPGLSSWWLCRLSDASKLRSFLQTNSREK